MKHMKMKKPIVGRKVNQYRTYYYKEIAATLTLLFIWIMYLLWGSLDDTGMVYVADEKVAVRVEATVPNNKAEMEKKIKEYFPRSWRTMIPIAYAESGMRNTAVNYNCYYNKDKTIVYTSKVKGSHSTSCKKGHEVYAHSTDCFVLQRNYKGKGCPKDVTLDEHLEDVAKLSRVQGLQAWSSYNSNKHLLYAKN